MWNEGILGVFLCGCVTVMLLVFITRRIGEKEGFPPGPWAWPVLGHLHLFAQSLPHQTLAALSKQYGPVVGLRLGRQLAIVVSSPASAKEVLLTHDKLLAERPVLEFTSTMLFGSQTGLVFTPYGPAWRKHRKICTLHLFTTKRMQELQYVRQQELRTLLRSIHDQSSAGSRAVELGKCVRQMVSRLMMRLVQSKVTVQTGDESWQQIIRHVEKEMQPTTRDLSIPFLPMLDFFQKQRMNRIHAQLDKMYTEMLTERRRTESVSPGAHDDLLQTLLSKQEELTVVDIKSILHDILSAGISTTSLTLEWAMAELLRNPECLQRLQREINAQVGEKQEVSEADLPKLKYLKCVIKEVFRLHPIAPLLIRHRSTEECKLQGYRIPARTYVLVNVWAIGRDEGVWPNAAEFMPARFEGKEEVDVRGQHFELLPFGSGRRSCLGMPLALCLVETTLANLVSCFDWELPNGETHAFMTMDKKKGVAAIKPTPVVAIPKARISFAD